jgi:hypothetical protein
MKVTEVLSGYRWVLTYKVVKTSSAGSVTPHPSAADLDYRAARFREALEAWCRRGQPGFLCHVLEHEYTKSGLNQESMKGRDSFHIAYIARICAKSGRFRLFLANLERRVKSNLNNEGGEEDAETESCLHRIAYLDGDVVQDSLLISEECLIQQHLYDDRDPDEQVGGQYLGNEHVNFEKSYKNAVCDHPCQNGIFAHLAIGLSHRS